VRSGMMACSGSGTRRQCALRHRMRRRRAPGPKSRTTGSGGAVVFGTIEGRALGG
jgi:hypothetical protein